MNGQCFSTGIPSNRINGPTLNVGVRRPFSNVNGSATSVTALANSKPRSWYNKHRDVNLESHLHKFKYGKSMQRFEHKIETCASFPIESMSARTAALALGSAQSCLKSSYCMLDMTCQSTNKKWKYKDLYSCTIQKKKILLVSETSQEMLCKRYTDKLETKQFIFRHSFQHGRQVYLQDFSQEVNL